MLMENLYMMCNKLNSFRLEIMFYNKSNYSYCNIEDF